MNDSNKFNNPLSSIISRNINDKYSSQNKIEFIPPQYHYTYGYMFLLVLIIACIFIFYLYMIFSVNNYVNENNSVSVDIKQAHHIYQYSIYNNHPNNQNRLSNVSEFSTSPTKPIIS